MLAYFKRKKISSAINDIYQVDLKENILDPLYEYAKQHDKDDDFVMKSLRKVSGAIYQNKSEDFVDYLSKLYDEDHLGTKAVVNTLIYLHDKAYGEGPKSLNLPVKTLTNLCTKILEENDSNQDLLRNLIFCKLCEFKSDDSACSVMLGIAEKYDEFMEPAIDNGVAMQLEHPGKDIKPLKQLFENRPDLRETIVNKFADHIERYAYEDPNACAYLSGFIISNAELCAGPENPIHDALTSLLTNEKIFYVSRENLMPGLLAIHKQAPELKRKTLEALKDIGGPVGDYGIRFMYEKDDPEFGHGIEQIFIEKGATEILEDIICVHPDRTKDILNAIGDNAEISLDLTDMANKFAQRALYQKGQQGECVDKLVKAIIDTKAVNAVLDKGFGVSYTHNALDNHLNKLDLLLDLNQADTHNQIDQSKLQAAIIPLTQRILDVSVLLNKDNQDYKPRVRFICERLEKSYVLPNFNAASIKQLYTAIEDLEDLKQKVSGAVPSLQT